MEKPPSTADELTKLAALKDRGLLTQDEFDQQKRKLLAADTSPPPADEAVSPPIDQNAATCPNCGGNVRRTALWCPKCKADFGQGSAFKPIAAGQPRPDRIPTASPPPPPEKTASFKWWLWGPLGLFALVMIVGTAANNTPDGQARTKDRRAIDACWDEQKRKSLDPGSARFVAGACEMLEQKFKERHGFAP